MKAGIIAAGEGLRLRQDGVSTLKPLVKINGVSLIERLLSAFQSRGIEEVFIIINEDSREVKTFVEQQQFSIPVHFHIKTTASSMHSLFELAPYLRDGSFLLSTVDTIFQPSELQAFLQYAMAKDSKGGADGILAVTEFVQDENPLWVHLDQHNRILQFGKGSFQLKYVTGGIYFFSSRIFNEMVEARLRNVSRLRNFLGLLLEKEYRLEGYKFSTIVDVDHIKDVQAAEQFLGNLKEH